MAMRGNISSLPSGPACVGEFGLQILGRRHAVAGSEPVDLSEQLLLHLRVLGDEVERRGESERRRGRPGEEVLVSERADVVRREQLPRGFVRLSRREHDGQEVLALLQRRRVSLHCSRPLGDDPVKLSPEREVHAVDLVVRRPAKPLENLPERFMEERQELADDDGERAGHVHF
ncbi:Os01g0701100 [Oryza sativa Japonica Group]|uniref:Os01g0701100 protein n=1 Tax=Oryza sativa subsp. japonica TaxID=39947 RepID=A0A0P0V725_ORYSJ|nr:Os01g0701100 [Oryza sativa Japonica Group]